VTAACGDDSGDSGGKAGSGAKGNEDDGGTAGKGGSDAGSVQNPDPINDNCPGAGGDVGPHNGEFGPKGECCYRTSNKARVDKTSSERVLEFRLNYFFLINLTNTIDPGLIGPLEISRFDNEEQSLLFRMRLPQENGKVIPGTAHMQIGGGRYNCDGTYSFYGPTAAPPDVGTHDPGRWQAAEFDATVDPTKTDRNYVRPTFKQALAAKNTESSLPYLNGDLKLDFEGESQGFDILEMPSGDEHMDCVGSRSKEDTVWLPAGKTVAYARVDLNDTDIIDTLGVNFSQLMGFGTGGKNAKPQTTARCMPGDQGCAWKRLPDSLCPVTDDEKKQWGCHLGSDINKDNSAVTKNCSDDPPKDINPDNGTVEGQCCDPLGKSDKIPMCNAWVQINEFVAAAVEITDDPVNEVQQSCHGK
jgi:hypothetical protein